MHAYTSLEALQASQPAAKQQRLKKKKKKKKKKSRSLTATV
jgi:hypothetical protein